MNLQIVLVPESEKEMLRNMMQAYLHDMSEFDDSDLDTNGLFSISSYFDAYWIEAERHPFKILVDDKLAGFALVREIQADTYSIAEFFVLRKYRRRGVGRLTAFRLFDEFQGHWHVAQDEENFPAQAFWRSIIGDYSGGAFEERVSQKQPKGPKQVFSSPQ